MSKKKFKLGLFAFNASSGSTITNHKKKWRANTDKIIKLAKEADEWLEAKKLNRGFNGIPPGRKKS